MQMTIVEKPSVENEVSAEMEIVEVDDGLVEMLNRSKAEKSTKKKVVDDVEEITIDSDSEEEDVAVVKADQL